MIINDSYTVNSENEAQNLNADLRENGYTRVTNYYWYEVWKKGDHSVLVERDF